MGHKWWTKSEIESLMKSVKDGMTFDEISESILPNRTAKGCKDKYRDAVKNGIKVASRDTFSMQNQRQRETKSIRGIHEYDGFRGFVEQTGIKPCFD